MDTQEFIGRLRSDLPEDPRRYYYTISEDSALCHIVNVPADLWVSGHISAAAGRWNLTGQDVRYFATNFKVCAVEIGLTKEDLYRDRVFELYRTTGQFTAFDVRALSPELKTALYEDRGPPPGKWVKSHALISELPGIPGFERVGAIWAPSASGERFGIQGMCLTTDPAAQPIELVARGEYTNWLSGELSEWRGR